MNILFFVPRFHTNQIDIAKALIQKGHKVLFHVRNKSIIEDYTVIKPWVVPKSKLSIFLCKIFKVQANSLRFNFPSFYNYFNVLKQEKIQLIVIRDPTSIAPILVSCIARLNRIPIVFYTQMVINKRYSPLRYLLYKTMIRLFKAAWFSPVLGPVDRSLNPKIKHLFYIPFPILSKKIPNKLYNSDQVFNFLMIGKFQPRKNHILLLKSLHFLQAAYRFRIVLVGECTTTEHLSVYKEVLNFIKDHNMGEIVEIFINVKPSQMHVHFNNADVFVLPSSNEPASISILEAMSYGLPVIVSDDCGNKDYVKDAETGFHFQSGSEWDLTNKIEELLSSIDTLTNFRQSSYIRIKNNYSYEEFSAKFNDMVMKRFKL